MIPSNKKYVITPDVPKYPPIPLMHPGEIWRYCRHSYDGASVFAYHNWKRGTQPIVTGIINGNDEFVILVNYLTKDNTFYIRIMICGTSTIGWIYVDSKNYEKHFDLVWA